ncbi:retrovirus-related pol polyprotein from transposon TNT 1-94 [Tanacetum coccineum]|uniref:Retrovirus-related pol polyprotein from transposon TNT 1-94 n=1 Tax=Tanacetum coccineum TaxID=301880 RepID=A0ABQ5EVL4_9ASTR
MIDKVVLVKEKPKAARDRQKSYADKRRKPLEFEEGPFEILERIVPVAYRLRLPEELIGVHDTFHVSNLKKCLGNANLHVPLNEIEIDKTLHFVEEPVEIIDREVKSLKRSRIPLVKVRWNSKHGPEFTWEHEDYMKPKYPQLFIDRAVKPTTCVDIVWKLLVHQCDIRKPIWYLDSGCSRHVTGVKNYLYKYVEQPGPKVVFGDDSTCISEGQLCDAKYIILFDEKRGTIFNSNKEVVMIAPRTCSSKLQNNQQTGKKNLVIGLPSLVYSKDKPCSSCEKGKHLRASFKTKQTSPIKKCLHLLHMDLFRPVTPRSINHEKYTLVIVDEYSRNSILVNFYDENGISQNFSSPYTPEQNGVAERKNRTLIEAARTMLSGSVFSKQYWIEAVATTCYAHNKSTIFTSTIIKDHLGKFDEKTDDGYLLRYSLVSKAFRVFNTRRQQNEETYHITFDESLDAIKFSKPSVENINIAENIRYPPDEYLHPYEPSQRYQTNSNDVSFIEPYESPEPVVLETEVSSDQNGQTYQTDQTTQTDEILNDNPFEHSNHNNDEQIIDNLPNIEDIQISKHLSSPNVEDTSIFSLKKNLKRNKVWTLVPALYGKNIIGSKWVFRNKRDETGIVIKNKARLVAQSYNQQEGIDYDVTFAPIVRLEAIRIFLAFATYMNFIVYQIDVKSAFLNGKLKEEVYFKQPLGFKSNEFPNYVCKLDKALYRLKQAPRAWYETSQPFSPNTSLQEDLLKKYDINGSSVKTLMVPPNNLGPDLSGKAVNETQCRGFDLKGYSDYSAKKQQSVAMSLAEAEYAAAARYHFMNEKDHILKGGIELYFIPTQYQLADIFTKSLDEPNFKRLIVELGMLNIDSKLEASILFEEN